MLSDSDTEDIFSAIHGDTQNHISSLGHIAVILFDLVVDGIHEDERIDVFQRPILPGIDLRHDLFADLAYQIRRDFHIVKALDLLCDVPLAHAAGVEGQDFVGDL